MIGNVLGNYRIERELGRGGMGVVYAGTHTLLGRTAAIKVLLPKYSRDDEIVQRFFNEARAAAAIKHPGIVEIYDFGHAGDGSAYIVMERCDGDSLATRLRRPLSMAKALTLARHIAGTLAAAHRAGIIHRDLKPDNVFVVPDPDVAGGERIKLLDFGIAKLATDSAGPSKTTTGVIMGTPNYMSPEQCRGAGQIDPRSDLYSLGVILFELVCARLPFSGEGSGDIIGAHLHIAPPSPRSLVPDVPAELEQLLLQLLAKKPADRPSDADAVVAELDRMLPAIPPDLGTAFRPAHVSGVAATLPSDQPFDALGPTAATTPPRGEVARAEPARPASATAKVRRRWWLGLAAAAIALSAAIALIVSLARHRSSAVESNKTMVYDFAGSLVEVIPGSSEPTVYPATPNGTFGKAFIRGAVEALRPMFGYCYSQRGLTGNGVTIDLGFTIGLAGDISDITVKHSDPQLVACMTDVARNLRFPRPPSKVSVNYPLKFLIGPPAAPRP